MPNNSKKPRVVSLKDVHDVIQRWLYMPNTERVDIILAVVLSLFYEGNPLWLFIIGRSGDAKSEIIRALEGLQFIRKIDQLTKNTLASGRKDVKDVGSELQNKKTILLFEDLACLISLNKDEKKQIWSQFRTLYDGDIYKDAGSGAHIKYHNCHVVIIACVTRVFKEEYHVHQQLGSRELLYDTAAEFKDNLEKMRRVTSNIGKRQQIRKDIKDAVHGFILTHKFNNDIQVPEGILEYIYQQCQLLTLLRATAAVDWYSGELDQDADTEVPTRLSEQFIVLYKALHSLDPEYDDQWFKNIVENIVLSSSHPVRHKLYQLFKDPKNKDQWLTVPDLMTMTKLGRKSVKSQCEILWNLGSLDKDTREEVVGAIERETRDGDPYTTGGHKENVDYYRARKTKKHDQQEGT